MKIGNTSYRGMAPRITPRALPEGAAQEAVNCRLKRGDIEPWRQFAQTATLSGISNPATIFRLKATTWLAFTEQTDIARAAVSGGLDNRVLLTCPDLFPTPRYTDFVSATTGSPPFPVTTHPLGVPAPDSPPGAVLGVDSTPTTFSIDVLDEGDALSTAWSTSPDNFGIGGTIAIVSQATASFLTGTCYELIYNEIHGDRTPPSLIRNFNPGLGDATVIHATAKVAFKGDTSVRNIAFLVAGTTTGSGVMVVVYNGSFELRNANELNRYTASLVESAAVTTAGGTVYTIDVTITVNSDGTQTVTAKLLSGVTELASITGTNTFALGPCCGFTAGDPSDSGLFQTEVDDIHVQASGSTGLTPNLTAVNYVYTYVNDLGEEGAPSFPTQDLLRPDGVTVTLTTLTAAPVANSVTYSKVTTKRIYRLVSGTTGDVYRLVTEIPLATADFVDDLTDNELPSTLLESEEYDLPHPDMEGIISLPNGLCAGFFENQLCLSATGWCHAWPVRQRLRVDSDIVAICNINNTIVIGTKTFVYTATGNDGASYSMSKPGAAQACTSKLGMTFLDGQGVIFPSPDGWCVCAGSANNVPVVSEGIFTKEQWQQYDPTSIIAAVHDNVLHWYWKTAPADTVLFLFHMTETATAEGIAEFTGATTSADQTGATWTADGAGWDLLGSGPAAKFGLFWLGSNAGQSVTWLRDASQVDPVPDTVAIGTNTALTIDTWIYRGPGASGGVRIRVGASYPDFFVLNADEFDTQAQMWGGGVFLNAGSPVAEGQWTHLRLTYVGDVLRLFIDGLIAATSSSTPGLLATIDPITTMDVRVENFYGIGFLCDEATAFIGTSASTTNFTPPVAPWSNP